MTTRAGGVSAAPFDTPEPRRSRSATRPSAVAANRRRFAEAIGARAGLPAARCTATRVVRLDAGDAAPDAPCTTADACVTTEPGVACTVRWPTACRCCSPRRTAARVGAAHAGWRGLAGGRARSDRRRAVRGGGLRARRARRPGSAPASGRDAFEVGADVLEAFGADAAAPDAPRASLRPQAAASGWPTCRPGARPAGRGRRRARSAAARLVHRRATASRFFSFRRDGVTGRMAAAVWIGRGRWRARARQLGAGARGAAPACPAGTARCASGSTP